MLLILVIVLVIVIIIVLLAKKFPRKSKEKEVPEKDDYQPVSTRDETKPHHGTRFVVKETITFGKPIMTKEGTQQPPRTDELRKKYLLY